jgi:hypothetical protein
MFPYSASTGVAGGKTGIATDPIGVGDVVGDLIFPLLITPALS